MSAVRRAFARRCVCCGPAAFPVRTTRRNFIAGGVTALGLGAAVSMTPGEASGQAPAPAKPHRIDVHHHIAPPKYVAEFRQLMQPPTANWTVQKSLDDMDQAGVATSIASVTTPVSIFIGKEGKRVARECNDYTAKLVQDHPGRFGMFAMLPLTDVDASLREIEYGFDTLHADGVAVFTSYGDKWLGDPAFDRVMEELNRRKALVFTHPDAPNCCQAPFLPDVGNAVIEYATDTTRAIARVMFSGTALRYRDINWIFSHGGGTAPYLAERLERHAAANKNLTPNFPNGVLAELRRFHYDVAQAAHPAALAAITRLIPTSQLLWGTDFPFRKGTEYVKFLADYGFGEDGLRKIDRENALRLLPKWRAG
jgi:predicted TIM-barrel fold metal-dependent hydrolase